MAPFAVNAGRSSLPNHSVAPLPARQRSRGIRFSWQPERTDSKRPRTRPRTQPPFVFLPLPSRASYFLAAATCAKGSSFRLNQLRVVVLRAVDPPDDRVRNHPLDGGVEYSLVLRKQNSRCRSTSGLVFNRLREDRPVKCLIGRSGPEGSLLLRFVLDPTNARTWGGRPGFQAPRGACAPGFSDCLGRPTGREFPAPRRTARHEARAVVPRSPSVAARSTLPSSDTTTPNHVSAC